MERKLRELGLTDYEIKCYLTLIRYGSLNGLKLSRLSNIPQGKVYHIANRLNEKGFVSLIDASPKLFKAVNPSICIPHIISNEKERLEEIEKELPDQINELKKLELKDQETDERITVLRGKKNASSIVQYIYRTAKRSLDIMFTCETLSPVSQRLLIKAQQNNVKLRIIITTKNNPGLLNNLKKLGFSIRYYPVQEIRIFIKDDEESIQMLVSQKDLLDRTNIFIQSKELTNALKYYYEAIWKKAKIIKQ